MCTCIEGYLKIEGWGNRSHVWNSMKKTWKDNQKVEKNSWIINQVLTLGLEHDKIWTRWVSNIMLKNMLERECWCRCSKMEFWNQIICYSMNCLNKEKHVRTIKDHMLPLGVIEKGRHCYQFMLKFQEGC